MKNRGPMIDARLKHRVKQYLSNSSSQYVDLAIMASDLQRQYSMDYGRRKKNVFRIQVEKVYQLISGEVLDFEEEHLAKRARPSRYEDCAELIAVSSDNEDFPEYPPTNLMNSSLLSLYRRAEREPSAEATGGGPARSGSPRQPTPPAAGGSGRSSVTAEASSGGWFIDSAPANALTGHGRSTQPAGRASRAEGSGLVPEPKKRRNGRRGRHHGHEAAEGSADRAVEASVLERASAKRSLVVQYSSLTFEDVGGSDKTLKDVCWLLVHLRHPEVYEQLGVHPPRGFLLHGPPGCGKTLLAQAIAGELQLPLLKVAATELVSGVSGESEQKLRGLFEEAVIELRRLRKALRDPTPVPDRDLQELCLEMSDFTGSLSSVQPSAKREGFATVPDVTWADIGALEEIREELTMAILAPLRHPQHFEVLGLSSPAGVLLAGPPGCGKTLLAKAVANESGLNFISVKGPELLNMYVGESERAVRQVFQRARNSAPCVIFFDEIDSLCPRRSGYESGASERVVNQLLTEMDGLEARKQVFIMAATNRPDIIDTAVLRPGRLDKTLYVGLPPAADRLAILQTLTKGGTRPPMDPDVDLCAIAYDQRCECFTGADLSALLREASVSALRQQLAESVPASCSELRVACQHFETAFGKVKPSVSKRDQLMYECLRRSLTR
ncbi:LOW QUALITY PROTEIN: nuclear valosin-containing protein-like [Rhinoraja longicauda]